MPIRDLAGQRFGRLTALEWTLHHGRSAWVCRCDCGALTTAYRENLASGHTKSCGCFRRDDSPARFRTHGASKTAVYKAWAEMRRRCTNPRSHAFADYGGRGITVCDEWHAFDAFARDMGPRPQRGSLERIDNNGPYEPANCRWATHREQGNNKRNNRLITFQGVTLTLAEWGRRCGFPRPHTLLCRLKRGWTVERALTEPLQQAKKSA